MRPPIAGQVAAVAIQTHTQWADHQYSAALCQVFDSIFYDVPMARVKFNANTEYAYLQNFKILQSRSPYYQRPAGMTDTNRHIRQAPG